jgi:hypothetical protein
MTDGTKQRWLVWCGIEFMMPLNASRTTAAGTDKIPSIVSRTDTIRGPVSHVRLYGLPCLKPVKNHRKFTGNFESKSPKHKKNTHTANPTKPTYSINNFINARIIIDIGTRFALVIIQRMSNHHRIFIKSSSHFHQIIIAFLSNHHRIFIKSSSHFHQIIERFNERKASGPDLSILLKTAFIWQGDRI